MKRLILMLLPVALLLTGCASLLDGNYHNVTPHKDDSEKPSDMSVTVSEYASLYKALTEMVENGVDSGLIFVPRYNQSTIEKDMKRAVDTVSRLNPIAAYAVDSINWELGINSGQSAISVKVRYTHDLQELRKIRRVSDIEAGTGEIAKALKECSDKLVLYVQNYKETDFVQLVEDYADANPQVIMETPQVKVNVYSDTGNARVVELRFTYQSSRDLLRSYQTQVGRIFESAKLYVSSDAAQVEQYAQLYSFLMQRHEYKMATSITPAYSLLRHGEGNAKAFATVYAAMCRESGLECQVITGTRWGEAWYWNLVCDDGVWYHVDLLRCSEEGMFIERAGADMEGYVWDYSAYPDNQKEVTE